jgi:WD40 repeat protein
MSATSQNIFGAIPATTRGKSVHVGGDPKGKNWLYCCGNSVFIRDLKDPLKTELYQEHSHQTTVARYSPSGFYVASADVTGTVRIWDTTQKEHILKIELKVISGPITDLQWSDDSKRIVAVGEGKEKFGSVFLFDSGSSVGEITGHTKFITSCDLKQTRPYRLITGSEDSQVSWLEGPPFKFKKSYQEHSRFVTCVRFSPDGDKFLTVGTDKAGHLYDGKTGDYIGPLSTENGHTAGIYSASWSPDSKQFLTASADKTCKIWDAESRKVVKTFTFEDVLENQQLGALWQGDTLISIALSGDVYYLDVNSPNKPLRVLRGHNKFITALAYDPNTRHLYSASYDASIVRWDIASGATEGFRGKGHGNQINAIHVQGKNIVTAAMDDSVRITSLESREYSGDSIKLDSIPADAVVGKRDLKLVVAVTTDSVVVLKDGRVASKLPVKYQPLVVGLSVDETEVAVGGKDNNIYLYNLAGTTLTEKAVLKGHRGALSSVTFSPDGQWLASSDSNRDIFVWDRATNQIKVQGWVFHTARVNSLSWAPDSVHLASGSLDGHVFIWDVLKTDKRIQIKDAHRGGVNATLWIDGNTVATAGQDCTVKTWSITFH